MYIVVFDGPTMVFFIGSFLHKIRYDMSKICSSDMEVQFNVY